MDAVGIGPEDDDNERLLANVHPAEWTNPTPAPRYNLVVVGAGTAGLVAAAGAAGLGARVALVERGLMGGDCLNFGCVPSKALLAAARARADVRRAAELGVVVPGTPEVDFAQVMARMRRLRADISINDSAQRFRELGVDVFLGEAAFSGADRVSVGEHTLVFSKACVATGARAASLPIPGLDEAGFLTNESVFALTELPRRLAVLGAGPIGVELAQAFARLGSDVVLLEVAPRILLKEDEDAAVLIEQVLRRDGVSIHTDVVVTAVACSAGGKLLSIDSGGTTKTLEVDEILLGVGRKPNVEGLALSKAGVSFDAVEGVKVNDRLQTANANIFAAGDVCSPYKFTHAADAMARIVIQNALFLGRAKASTLAIPWCTYTDPEVAHVGLYEHEAAAQGKRTTTFTEQLADIDRAILDGETEGFVKILSEEGSDQVLGATVVARHAGEMISEITLAMVGGLGLKTIARTIHPYPTQALAIKRAGDAYMRTRLTPGMSKLMAGWHSLTR